jgi:tight adherence protein C
MNISALLDLELPTIIMLVVAAAAVVSVIAVGLNFVGRGKRGKRIEMVLNKRRGELSKQQLENLASKPSTLRQAKQKAYVELANKIFRGLSLENLISSKIVRESLAQAGFRGRSVIAVYFACRILGVLGGMLLAVFLISQWQPFPYPNPVKFLFYGIGAAVGFYMPQILLTNMAQKRQQSMNEAFPDAMDLLVICVEAGSSVENALGRVTEEIMETSAILAQEIGLTAAELAYLGDRRIAYENFALRTGLPAAKALATTLIQSEKYGTPVGVALKVLAQEKRDERMAMAEKKAGALPAKLTVPMIVFFLPLLFLVVIGPAAIQITNF